MRKKKKRIIVGILIVVIAAWLILMWRLSTADGTATLRDSMRFARRICTWLYGEPTYEQLSHVNLILRKFAHVFLYLILGGISAVLWQLLLERISIWKRMIPAIICCTAIAFLDELQKIPIVGRHFSCSESFLNAASAALMILLCTCVVFLLDRKRKRSQ